ncbi:surfeit locus protein 6 [Pangasianodon hypophthalmus]|uniref:surfeit locus protein 6 n=1 Tax=Pangasianodon hypophthalmus TaxID=310915 RepID=UPI00147C3179|nr:surfeit locus protein 6 [Pangasianodon hypophthalmus]XP_034156688.1 surfeit locus protein 6 [Pangasianodon hypophthalmus]XP_034156690.1 surfeit locus protein 6 [Pangasianodon hypophthalmus]
MSSLAAKYDYLQKFTRKSCHSEDQKPKKRGYVPFRGKGVGEGGPLKKKQKNNQDPRKGRNMNTNYRKPTPKSIHTAVQNASQVKVHHGQQVKMRQKTEGTKSEEYNAVDILRKRLHEKIEASRGQGTPKDPSSEEVQKRRAKRKQERERKKRKRKEFRMKKLADSISAEVKVENETEPAPVPQSDSTASKPAKKDTNSIVFNKVEVGEEYVDKGTKLTEKKKRKAKGTLTPLTGRNYKQLLSRVEARKARLEELREKDEKKAKKEEEKMRWTNVLYKAEGMKIKDNEDLLRASLKRKEKMKTRRKKKWAERSQHVLEKMQQRQDKRRRNIQKFKQNKMEKRKQRVRKKGRVLPEDLKKAAV